MEDKILNELDLCVLEDKEATLIAGGSLIDFSTSLLKKITPAAFAIWVIDNWEDVKTGFSDGWNVR